MNLRVRGIADEAHAGRVADALRATPGVFGVVVSASTDCVEVDFEDDELSIDQIIDVLRGAGCTAEIAG